MRIATPSLLLRSKVVSPENGECADQSDWHFLENKSIVINCGYYLKTNETGDLESCTGTQRS